MTPTNSDARFWLAVIGEIFFAEYRDTRSTDTPVDALIAFSQEHGMSVADVQAAIRAYRAALVRGGVPLAEQRKLMPFEPPAIQ